MSKELAITIDKADALRIFTTDKALDPYIEQVRAAAAEFVPDISTKKGRDEIASNAHKIAKIKTYVEGIGKEVSADAKNIPKLIDAGRNYVKEELQKIQDAVRAPLTEWEEKEEARIAKIKADLAEITGGGLQAKNEWDTLPVETMQDRLKEIQSESMTRERWGEFLDEAEFTQGHSITTIQEVIARRLRHDADQLELIQHRQREAERAEQDRIESERKEAEERIEQQRKEQLERDEQLREEARQEAERAAEAERQAEANRVAAIQKEAEQKARRERDEANQREENLRLETERLERERLAGIERERLARIEAERLVLETQRRIEQERKDTEARIKREAQEKLDKEATDLAKREANQRHLKKFNNEAKDAFVAGGLTEEQAKLAVELIARKIIPHVSIVY